MINVCIHRVRLNMTEKLFTGTLNKNQNKKVFIGEPYGRLAVMLNTLSSLNIEIIIIIIIIISGL